MKTASILKITSLSILPLLLLACDAQDSDGNRVSLGTAVTLFSLGELQYQEQFVVQVTNPSGDPSPFTSVTFSLQPLGYNKGYYVETDIDVPADGTPDRWVPYFTASCDTEDLNNNGILDAGEDVNANGILEPRVPTITAHPDLVPTITSGTSSLVTDENGFGYVAVTYPKSESSWVKMQLTAFAQDGLPGNTAVYSWTLHHLIADVDDVTTNPPGGVVSPYGLAANCSDAN